MAESLRPKSADAPPSVRVALMVSFLNDEYEWSIVRGVRQVVEEQGGSVYVFAGGSLADPDAERRSRNAVFQHLERSLADGIVCVSSCVTQHLTAEEGARWLGQFGLPVVSVGALPGLASVCIEDSDGVTQLVRHLVEHHGHRRIAFITGTPTNTEAQARRAAYLAALEALGIEHDPRLMLVGDFTRESGARAVTELFDTRQVRVDELDAILASNDYTAFGAIDELSRRRIGVPDQVAVAGFDDMRLSRVYDPPLTTICQPLEQLGRESARRLLGALRGHGGESLVMLGTDLLLRRSCGCVPTDIPPPPDAPNGAERATQEMLSGLTAELRGERGAFARALDPLLRRLAAGSARELEQNRRLADELGMRLRAAGEDLVYDRLHQLARALELRMFGPQAQLSRVLAELLPALGSNACSVAEASGGAPGELKLAFGFDAQSAQPQMVPFSGKKLVPPGLERLLLRSAFVLPLCYGEESLGIAVIEAGDREGIVYETLAEVFSVVTKAIGLRRRAEGR